MTPNLLVPPEIATATPPAWAIVTSLLFAVLLAVTITLLSLANLAP